jgi:hypothetical protein
MFRVILRYCSVAFVALKFALIGDPGVIPVASQVE